VKGEGNQQDYGMRIYDPRIGKFLSVDPLTNQFGFLTPYQYAGNTPIRAIDKDGEEPKDYSWNWKNKGESYLGKWGQDVQNVYDKWTKTIWSIMSYPNHNEIYYWKPYNGSQGTFDFEHNGEANKDANGNWTGAWQRFERQETIQARIGSEVAEIFGEGAFASALTGVALPFMAATGGGSLLMASSPETLGIGAAKFGIGAVADILAQQTVNGAGSKLNLLEVGLSGVTSMFGMNAYTSSALSNLAQLDDENNTVLPGQSGFNVSNYTANTLLGGLAGAAIGKALPGIGPVKGAGNSNNSAQIGGATIVNYWGGTASGAGARAISEAQRDNSNKQNQ
ncbi:RHS repeat-associated core domain-containing protein, partial [Flavihumibacter sp. ZG627]|uniref:RHS repeat-associated core domain-containing protein n=1 Tax=Flavihumibacter sp. ZG627 TaxID=1463156 RepID=UPI00057F7505